MLKCFEYVYKISTTSPPRLVQSREGLIILAATNRLDQVDPALCRPGRFDRLIALKAPTEAGRLAILRVQTRTMPLEEDVNLIQVAQRSEGFSGADIASLARMAALSALEEDLHACRISMRHFVAAFDLVQASLVV